MSLNEIPAKPSLLARARSAVARFECTKLAAQLFRFARLTTIGVATTYVAHNAVTTTAVVAIAEVAFRQVFD